MKYLISIQTLILLFLVIIIVLFSCKGNDKYDKKIINITTEIQFDQLPNPSLHSKISKIEIKETELHDTTSNVYYTIIYCKYYTNNTLSTSNYFTANCGLFNVNDRVSDYIISNKSSIIRDTIFIQDTVNINLYKDSLSLYKKEIYTNIKKEIYNKIK